MSGWLTQYWELIGIYCLACSWILHETMSANMSRFGKIRWCFVITAGFWMPIILLEVARVVLLQIIRAYLRKGKEDGTDETDTE